MALPISPSTCDSSGKNSRMHTRTPSQQFIPRTTQRRHRHFQHFFFQTVHTKTQHEWGTARKTTAVTSRFLFFLSPCFWGASTRSGLRNDDASNCRWCPPPARNNRCEALHTHTLSREMQKKIETHSWLIFGSRFRRTRNEACATFPPYTRNTCHFARDLQQFSGIFYSTSHVP